MIRIGRAKTRPKLRCYKPRKQRGLKRFGYKYKGERMSDAELEARLADDHFGDESNYEVKDGTRVLTEQGKKFDFWVYARKEIRAALKNEFRSKCAYCEYEIGVRTDFDVEHFRPKKAVNHSETRVLIAPGYYWLAAAWHNLMPSCQFCNQEREQQLAGVEGKTTLGKKNQFPLTHESHRVSIPAGDLNAEDAHRLLIDPSKDDPENHIYFVTDEEDEDVGFVKAVMKGGKPDPKGHTSQFVFALNTKILVDKRNEHRGELIRDLTRLVDTAKGYHKAEAKKDAEDSQRYFRLIESSVQDLRARLEPTAMFLGLSRQLVREWDERGEFVVPKQVDIDPMEMVARSTAATVRTAP